MTSIPVSTMVSRGIRILLLQLVALCLALPVYCQVEETLQEGDLLFCCTDSANAITAVTTGVDKLPIDHVAVVHRIGGNCGPLFVIEAINPTVCLTPWNQFRNNNSTILQGRATGDVDIPRSIKRCLSMVGKPYDDLYLPGDSALYCSELVQMNYVTSEGAVVFDPVPMSFHDDTGNVTEYWRDFYAQRGMVVPEGAPGSNPGELSRREQVSIIRLIYPTDSGVEFERDRKPLKDISKSNSSQKTEEQNPGY